MCQNDSPAEAWMTAVASTATACCDQFFNWNKEDCLEKTNAWLLLGGGGGDDDDEIVGGDVEGLYYADTTASICRADGPNRPSWLSAYKTTYSACCQKWFSWNLDVCMAANPDAASGNDDDDTVPPPEQTEYYPDSSLSKCITNGPNRPSWITTIVKDYDKCCQDYFSWNLVECLAAKPMVTQKPTVKVTSAPIVVMTIGTGGGGSAPMGSSPMGDTAPSSPVLVPYYETPAPVPSSFDCTASGVKRKECIAIEHCAWVRREGKNYCDFVDGVQQEGSGGTTVDCDDQTLSKGLCESNSLCVWYLKDGVACAYASQVNPTRYAVCMQY